MMTSFPRNNVTNNETWLPNCYFLPRPEFGFVEERQTTNLATAVINLLFVPVAIITNLLIILAISKNSLLQSPSNVLISCLAFSDLLVGLIVQPCFITFRIMENISYFVPCSFRVVYSESFWVCYGVSFMMLSAISFERYIALRLHLRYKNVVTTRCILIATTIVWVMDIAFTSFQWLWVGYSYVRVIQITLFLLCIVVTLFAHFKIFRIMMRHQKQIQAHEIQESRNYQKQTKLAINVTYIVGFYLLCNMPVLIVQLCQYAMEVELASLNVYSWVETIAFYNSTLNPLVCCWRNREIRRGIIRMIRRMLCTTNTRKRSKSSVYSLPNPSGNSRGDEPRNAKTEGKT